MIYISLPRKNRSVRVGRADPCLLSPVASPSPHSRIPPLRKATEPPAPPRPRGRAYPPPDPFVLDLPMLYDEFTEALARCAHLAAPAGGPDLAAAPLATQLVAFLEKLQAGASSLGVFAPGEPGYVAPPPPSEEPVLAAEEVA